MQNPSRGVKRWKSLWDYIAESLVVKMVSLHYHKFFPWGSRFLCSVNGRIHITCCNINCAVYSPNNIFTSNFKWSYLHKQTFPPPHLRKLQIVHSASCSIFLTSSFNPDNLEQCFIISLDFLEGEKCYSSQMTKPSCYGQKNKENWFVSLTAYHSLVLEPSSFSRLTSYQFS